MRFPSDDRPAGRTPDVRRETVERRILDGTSELLESGIPWHQIGIRQIAERADISRTAFYDFFAGKNDVLEQLVVGHVEELRLVLRETAAVQPTPWLDLRQIHPLIALAAEYFVRWGDTYQAFLDATSDDDRLGTLWDDMVANFTGLLSGSLDAARASDPELPRELPSRDVALTCLLMIERAFMVQRRASRGGPEGPRELVGVLTAACQMMVFGRTLTAKPPSA